MARKVGGRPKSGFSRAMRTWKVMPGQYAARQDEDEEKQDELCESWNTVVEEAREAWGHLEVLLELIQSAGGPASIVPGSSEVPGAAERRAEWPWKVER